MDSAGSVIVEGVAEGQIDDVVQVESQGEGDDDHGS